MALRRDENQYPHIPFAREPQRRGRRAPPPRRGAPPDPVQHGQEINEQITASLTDIQQSRVVAGIDPANLIVLEFGSIGFDLDENFAERFSARIIDERETKTEEGQRYRAVLQF